MKETIKSQFKGLNTSELADHLEALHKKLYDRLDGSKIKSKLLKKGKKSNIPGLSYYFKK
jgi:hypothetical protein